MLNLPRPWNTEGSVRAFEFPTTPRDPDSGYTLHGRRGTGLTTPYSWLERFDDPEAQAWIAAQEAVTHAVLRAVPGRDWLRAAVARAARYARLSPPIPAGPDGREFLWQTHTDDDSSSSCCGATRVRCSSRCSIPTGGRARRPVFAVYRFARRRPGRLGKAVGGTHGAVIHVLEVETGRPLCGPAERYVRRVPRLAARRVRVLLCGASRTG